MDTLRIPNRSASFLLGSHTEMLTQFFFTDLQRRRFCVRKVWFQQDGVTSHSGRASMKVFRRKFSERLISRSPWPPRSPDLKTCVFFWGGHFKSKIYQYKPRTLDELKDEITRVIACVLALRIKGAKRLTLFSKPKLCNR